jgi:hypothetical protein
MATTTNYSWSTPDDTALVKDGAAAIRTLGSSADTTVKALNPGTTAGDIDYYTTSTAKARVAIGTAGQVLQVNSGATAPEWATPASGGMTLISTTSLSGASVTLSSIPATYKNLQLVIRDILPATDGANLNIRLNGDSTASRYAVSSWGAGAGTAVAFSDDALNGSVGILDNTVTENMNIANFYDYTNTVTWKYGTMQGVTCNSTDPTQFTRGAYHLFYNQTSAISSITLFMSSGNITSGTALLYGVK